jgi:hypothetical protein
MKVATVVEYCKYHSCDKPCSNELRSMGGCMCNTMNWGKASGEDAIIRNKLIFLNNE